MNRIVLFSAMILLALSSIGMGVRLIYVKGENAKEKQVQDAAILQLKQQIEKSAQVSENLENELEVLRLQKEKDNEGVRNEISKAGDYSACKYPASGVQLFSEARVGNNQGSAAR